MGVVGVLARTAPDWTANPSSGHIQSTLAHELLIHRHGMDGWAVWKRPGRFDTAFGQSMPDFMADADARLRDGLGASIAP